jgi:hypothetical protein
MDGVCVDVLIHSTKANILCENVLVTNEVKIAPGGRKQAILSCLIPSDYILLKRPTLRGWNIDVSPKG